MGAERNRDGMSLRASFDVLLMERLGLSQTDPKRLKFDGICVGSKARCSVVCAYLRSRERCKSKWGVGNEC